MFSVAMKTNLMYTHPLTDVIVLVGDVRISCKGSQQSQFMVIMKFV